MRPPSIDERDEVRMRSVQRTLPHEPATGPATTPRVRQRLTGQLGPEGSAAGNMRWANYAAAAMLPFQDAGSPPGGGWTLIPGLSSETQANLFLSIFVIFAVFFIRRGVMAVVHRRVEDSEARYRWAKITSNVAFAIAVLFLVQIWFTALRSLGTFLGLVSAGLAIALRDLVAGLAGWGFITWRRPFDVGDRIQIGEHAGDVVDRRLFQFTIMEIGNWVDADQSTGRLIHIPNQRVFTEPLANYVAGFPYLWNEVKLLVTFESNWRKARKLVEELAADFTMEITKEATRPQTKGEPRFLIRYRKLTPVVYVSVKDSGILLTLRYLSRPRERRGTSSEIWERLLDLVDEHPDIQMAYPTQRINLSREVLAVDDAEVPGSDAEQVVSDDGLRDETGAGSEGGEVRGP